MYQCEKCREPFDQCVCPDEEVKEHPGFYFNRLGEEVLRVLRWWGLIK